MPLSIKGSGLTNFARPFSSHGCVNGLTKVLSNQLASVATVSGGLRQLGNWFVWQVTKLVFSGRCQMDGTQSAWAKHPEGKCDPDIVSSLALLNEKLLHKMAINLPLQAAGRGAISLDAWPRPIIAITGWAAQCGCRFHHDARRI